MRRNLQQRTARQDTSGLGALKFDFTGAIFKSCRQIQVRVSKLFCKLWREVLPQDMLGVLTKLQKGGNIMQLNLIDFLSFRASCWK